MLQALPNPPQEARAPQETRATVRNLALVAAVIARALLESSVRHGHEESDLDPAVSIVKLHEQQRLTDNEDPDSIAS